MHVKPKVDAFDANDDSIVGAAAMIKIVFAALEAVSKNGLSSKSCQFVIQIDHPDFIDVLQLFREFGNQAKMGLCVSVSDRFMEALEQQSQHVNDDIQMKHASAENVLSGHSAEDESAHTPYVRKDKKLGRNEPCWCGSGKKFKQCYNCRNKWRYW